MPWNRKKRGDRQIGFKFFNRWFCGVLKALRSPALRTVKTLLASLSDAMIKVRHRFPVLITIKQFFFLRPYLRPT
jgi:hypothetical protein